MKIFIASIVLVIVIGICAQFYYSSDAVPETTVFIDPGKELRFHENTPWDTTGFMDIYVSSEIIDGIFEFAVISSDGDVVFKENSKNGLIRLRDVELKTKFVSFRVRNNDEMNLKLFVRVSIGRINQNIKLIGMILIEVGIITGITLFVRKRKFSNFKIGIIIAVELVVLSALMFFVGKINHIYDFDETTIDKSEVLTTFSGFGDVEIDLRGEYSDDSFILSVGNNEYEEVGKIYFNDNVLGFKNVELYSDYSIKVSGFIDYVGTTPFDLIVNFVMCAVVVCLELMY